METVRRHDTQRDACNDAQSTERETRRREELGLAGQEHRRGGAEQPRGGDRILCQQGEGGDDDPAGLRVGEGGVSQLALRPLEPAPELHLAGAVGVLAPRGCLEARIRRLLEPAPIRRPVRRATLMGVVLVGGLVLAQTTVEGATHLFARVSAAAAEWEACCDPELSAVPHCAAPRPNFLPVATTACSSYIGRSSHARGRIR